MNAPNVQAVEEELIIAAGKSSFINAASGSQLDVGHELKSCTSSIQRSDVFTLAGRRIILIDTPGFDDTTVFLSITYEQGYKLSGVIYLHRISDVKVGGKSRRNLNMFRKLCGEEALRNVIFVTTMWDHVRDPTLPPRVPKCIDTITPSHLLGHCLTTIRNTRDTVVLQVQHELVDQSIEISDTAAGKELLLERELLMKKHVAELQDVEREIRDADEKRAKLHHDESIEVRRELQVKIRQLRQECKQLEDEHAAHMDALRAKIHEAKSALDAEKSHQSHAYNGLVSVVGASGSGKSTRGSPRCQRFSEVVHQQGATMSALHASGYANPVILIDTPGFDDTTLSDTEVLTMIASWLSNSYEHGLKLSGIIYMHRITDRRVGGVTRKNFRKLRELCGEETLDHVAIVTTMWDQEVSDERAIAREEELKTDSLFFKNAIEKGAQMLRHNNTVESARAILVDEKKDITQTIAGTELQAELSNLIQQHTRELQSLKEDLTKALEKKDMQAKQEIEEERAQMQSQLKKIEADKEQLRPSIARRKPELTRKYAS
ncbi:hypothetical protein BC629DRAFT_1596240 [Irpex lacteus]|nr:hypothetical protein BC629DRAFT_1596240 [Irpex lacteus]